MTPTQQAELYMEMIMEDKVTPAQGALRSTVMAPRPDEDERAFEREARQVTEVERIITEDMEFLAAMIMKAYVAGYERAEANHGVGRMGQAPRRKR